MNDTIMNRLLITLLLFLSILGARADEPVKREMRGTWIATIYGLDWPKMSGADKATADAQRASLCSMLDRLKGAGINAVMFQVRTFSDAMYRSPYEPWSAALTGKRGAEPADGWDPLAYCVEQAHARGMECHAWVNPFRYSTSAKPYADKFDSQLRPLLITHTIPAKGKRGKAKSTVILDPGNQKAREHVVKVCRDIVSRYDIDGLIFDDYFYPDRLPLGKGYDFNEWKKSGSKLSQADWRRENVNKTVAAIHEMLQEVKPYVQFGISPAGVGGGNGVAAGRYGLDDCTGNDWMYDRIFCDPLAWLNDGHIDYVSPQIYWTRDHATNPYEPIADWWSRVAVRFGRHFYASHSLSDFAKKGGDNSAAWRERGAQIEANRRSASNNAPGSIFYAARNINGFAGHLSKNQFARPALVPARDWKHAADPGNVTGAKIKNGRLTWKPVDDLCRYSVYAVPADVDLLDAMSLSYGGISADYLLDITYKPSYDIPAAKSKGYRYYVAPLDRYGNEWEATEVL